MLLAPICGLEAKSSTSALNKPFIYEITSNETTSYLFGSRHYGFGLEDLPSWVLDLQTKSEIHFYEIDMMEQSDYDLLVTIYQHPEVYYQFSVKKNEDQVQTLLTWNGISPEMAPYLPTSSCNDFYTKKRYFFDNKFKSLDAELQLRTKKMQKTLVTLDTDELRAEASRQTSATLIPSSYEAPCNLVNVLFNMELPKLIAKNDKLTNQTTAQYQSGDESYLLNPTSDRAEVIFRNYAWIKTLTPVLKSKSSFIVVGVGHLYGDEGLISLLQKQGFQVRRLSESPK